MPLRKACPATESLSRTAPGWRRSIGSRKNKRRTPGQPIVPGTQHDVDFMVKDAKRFADSGGWGYAEFEYDAASDAFRPGNSDDQPPQANDAKCGYACHTIVQKRDYVFTEYGHR
jgi:hypothetical protein